jgi:NAD(P)H-flavin reductase
VDADVANKEGWWMKPDYIINHININSAMFEPRHNSFFRANWHKTMKVCGYAYVGGGLKIIRAEISLDEGKSWEITDLTRPEDPIAEARGTDKHWCWSHWETEIDAARLKDCSEIRCRAVDSNQNMQPMYLTWNVMGMMNNCHFRIKVHKLEDGTGVWFEHPTQPGNEPGGWMTEDAGTFVAERATECAPGRTGVPPSRPTAAVWAPWQAKPSAAELGEFFLKAREFQKMPLMEKIIVNHDTRIFRFALPRPDMKLGLPTGQHIFLKAKYEDKVVMRPYSPMTDDDTVGHVDFIIKVYFKNVHPRFPEGGKMSQYLESMKIGETIDAKGPLGDFTYEGKGNFTWKKQPRQCKQLSLIAGGTGISLPYQVASKVLSDPNDTTKVKLLFANQTPDDILARDYIEELVLKHKERFEVWYTVDRVPETYKGEWKYGVGFVNDALISKALFPASEDTICLMCGPPIMYEKACIPNLLKVGYSRDNIFEG